MVQPPMISVVIPYHNEGPLLLRALESISRQSYTGSVEVIVVDDASEVPPPLPKETSFTLKCLRTEAPCFAGGARNQGIAAATGRYVAFLDSDDAYYPSRLADHVQFLENAADVVFVGGKVRVHEGVGFEKSAEGVDRLYPEWSVKSCVLP